MALTTSANSAVSAQTLSGGGALKEVTIWPIFGGGGGKLALLMSRGGGGGKLTTTLLACVGMAFTGISMG